MPDLVLLCPGPVNVLPGVRAAAAACPELCPGDPRYRDLRDRAHAGLLRALRADATHEAFLLPGTGTSAVEAMLLACTGTGALIADTGSGGDRLCRIAEAYALPHRRFGAASTPARRPDLDDLRRALRPDLDTLVVVHHETDTGLLNDLPALARFAKETNRRLLVDAVGSLGGEALDWETLAPEAVAAGSDVGLESTAGLAVVIVRRGARLRSRAVALDLAAARDVGDRDDAPSPAPAALLAALAAAAEDLEAETVAARTRRHRAASDAVRAAAEELGLGRLLPKKVLASGLTAFRLPEGCDPATVRARLREDGFVVPGEAPGAPGPTLRVATMGRIPADALSRLPEALARAIG